MRSISLLVPALVGVCVLAVQPAPAEACDDDDEEELDIDIDLDDDDDEEDDDDEDDDDDLDAFAPGFDANLRRRLDAHMRRLHDALGRVHVDIPPLPPLPPPGAATAPHARVDVYGDPQSGYWIDFDIDIDLE